MSDITKHKRAFLFSTADQAIYSKQYKKEITAIAPDGEECWLVEPVMSESGDYIYPYQKRVTGVTKQQDGTVRYRQINSDNLPTELLPMIDQKPLLTPRVLRKISDNNETLS